jgi:RNA polymerase sigma-70 factor, ECF subfamily
VESPHEQRLLREIRAGRREACAELVRAHYAAVYRFCAHLTGNVDLAEDLSQDTFTRAWINLAGFRGESSLTTWLHRIAYCGWLDGRRRAARGRAALDRLSREEAEPISGPLAPLRGLIVEEETRQLYAAVQRLTESHRVVVVLHYLQGLSYQEMAAVLAEPTGTVKARTRRALEQLRGFLLPEASHERTRGIERVEGTGGPASRPAPADGASGS